MSRRLSEYERSRDNAARIEALRDELDASLKDSDLDDSTKTFLRDTMSAQLWELQMVVWHLPSKVVTERLESAKERLAHYLPPRVGVEPSTVHLVSTPRTVV